MTTDHNAERLARAREALELIAHPDGSGIALGRLCLKIAPALADDVEALVAEVREAFARGRLLGHDEHQEHCQKNHHEPYACHRLTEGGFICKDTLELEALVAENEELEKKLARYSRRLTELEAG